MKRNKGRFAYADNIFITLNLYYWLNSKYNIKQFRYNKGRMEIQVQLKIQFA